MMNKSSLSNIGYTFYWSKPGLFEIIENWTDFFNGIFDLTAAEHGQRVNILSLLHHIFLGFLYFLIILFVVIT